MSVSACYHLTFGWFLNPMCLHMAVCHGSWKRAVTPNLTSASYLHPRLFSGTTDPQCRHVKGATGHGRAPGGLPFRSFSCLVRDLCISLRGCRSKEPHIKLLA